jgi:hypothetical protein
MTLFLTAFLSLLPMAALAHEGGQAQLSPADAAVHALTQPDHAGLAAALLVLPLVWGLAQLLKGRRG